MKRILILNNAYMTLPHYLYQSQRLSEELGRLGVQTDVRANDFFPAAVEEDGRVALRVAQYDACIYWDKDKYVSRLLEKGGLRLFNSAAAVELCDDKMTTAIWLAAHDVPMPYTMPGLLCYDPAAIISPAMYGEVERRLGYPFVMKTSYGSLGKGVMLVENRAQFEALSREYKCCPHLYQRFISESAGRDVRVIVVGGRPIAAMERHNPHDFRSNIELGGVATPYAVDSSIEALCERVVEVLGLDYCGIDLLRRGDEYLVCEVNSNAFFGGMERTTGVNVAAAYARYIYDALYA